jgi:DNA-binding NarL/FixJ family response regulator
MTTATREPGVRRRLVPLLCAAGAPGDPPGRVVPEASAAGRPGRESPVIRVVVVDDHPFVRESLSDLLEGAGGIAVIGQCADGSEVADAVRRRPPDVLLLDLQMPTMDGLTAARGVRASHPDVRVVILTSALDPESVRAAWAMGAAGYLLKDGDPDVLPGYVRSVAAGGSAWHPRARALLDGVGPASREAGGCPSRRRQSH